MGQQEVLCFLKKNKSRWVSVKELINSLEENAASVAKALVALRKSKFLDYKYIDNDRGAVKTKIMYKYKKGNSVL